AANVVAQLVGSKVAPGQPRARLEADHLEPRLRERQRGQPTGGAETDNDHVSVFESCCHRSVYSTAKTAKTAEKLSLQPLRPLRALRLFLSCFRERVVVVRRLVVRFQLARLELLLV